MVDNGQIDKTDQHMNHGQTDKKGTHINNEQQTKHTYEHKDKGGGKGCDGIQLCFNTFTLYYILINLYSKLHKYAYQKLNLHLSCKEVLFYEVKTF